MKGLVLDCSVVLAWCFEDESSRYADRVLAHLETGEAHVPTIWPLEVANALLVAERRKRLAEADAGRFVSLLEGLPIAVDSDTPNQAFGPTMRLARSAGLSAYDAAYLELAMRRGLPIATLDAKLKKAAKRLSAKLFA